jgi:hypothetical protein
MLTADGERLAGVLRVPVFDQQPADPRELDRVVGHNGQTVRQSDRGNHGVVGTDRLPSPFPDRRESARRRPQPGRRKEW